MTPQHLEPLAEMPLTPSGKINKNSLPAPMGLALHSAKMTRPQTPSQVHLVAIGAEILGAETPDINDDFFDYGGRSLFAAQLVARVN